MYIELITAIVPRALLLKNLGLIIAIVLIAIIFAVFGFLAYLFTPSACCSNVSSITAPSINLYSSNDTMAFHLNNQGEQTTVRSIEVTPGNGSTTLGESSCIASNSNIPNGESVLTCHVSMSMTDESYYTYVLDFQNGQSISGALRAQ